jgi:Domain of unknown function (DUF4150)
VCKTLTPPVPYMVSGKGGVDYNYASTVHSNGLIIKKANSKLTRTYGNQPGVGLGVKSGWSAPSASRQRIRPTLRSEVATSAFAILSISSCARITRTGEAAKYIQIANF